MFVCVCVCVRERKRCFLSSENIHYEGEKNENRRELEWGFMTYKIVHLVHIKQHYRIHYVRS